MEVILHDVWALLAGFAVMTAIVFAFTGLIAKLAPGFVGPRGRPQGAYILLNLVCSFAAAVAGGYVTAWLATGNPLPKVLMLAIVVLAISAISALEARDRQPVAYQLGIAVLAAAGVILGGWLRLRLLGLLG